MGDGIVFIVFVLLLSLLDEIETIRVGVPHPVFGDALDALGGVPLLFNIVLTRRF